MTSVKPNKSTMVELVQELEKLPPSPKLSIIITEAKAGEYHDYKNQKYACGKVAVVGLLQEIGHADLAYRVMNGEFDEEPDAEDRIMLKGIIRKLAESVTGRQR